MRRRFAVGGALTGVIAAGALVASLGLSSSHNEAPGSAKDPTADWTDVYAEVELTSSDHLAPAALRLSPLNPARDGDRFALRFRCSRSFGYGVPAAMVRRCLERLDEAGIPGRVRILRALSDTKPVQTQGPVWYAGGRVE